MTLPLSMKQASTSRTRVRAPRGRTPRVLAATVSRNRLMPVASSLETGLELLAKGAPVALPNTSVMPDASRVAGWPSAALERRP
jgi:hypothetical protein